MKKAIIIGGGIAGCSTAFALAKRGIASTLIERHHAVAQEASGNPVAMLYPKYNTGTSMISAIASEGFTYTSALLKQLPNAGRFYNQCGQIQLAFNAREQQNQRTLLHKVGSLVGTQLLSTSEASEVANIKLNVGGLYLEEAGWVKPGALCEALIQANNITCIAASKAMTVNQAGDLWRVQTGDQTLEADYVVICNANDIKQFDCCMHIPVTPVRGQVNFFEENKFSQQINTVICSDHYLSPAIDGFHSIGTSYAPNDLNPHISSEDTRANLRALKKISPALSNSIDLLAVTGRVAWRSATQDYIPLSGQLINEKELRKKPPRYNDHPNTLPWLTGLYVNAGHGSKGMITAPLCAELIANQICHEPFIVDKKIASTLNPNRFLLRELGVKKIAQSLYAF